MIKSFLKDNNIKQVYVSNKCPKTNIDFSEFGGYNKKIKTFKENPPPLQGHGVLEP